MKGSLPQPLCVKVFTTTGDPVIEEYPDVGYQTEGDLLRLWREKLAEPVVTMIDRESRLHLIPTAHIVKVVIASPEGGAPIRGQLPESDGAIPVLELGSDDREDAAGEAHETSYLDLPPDFVSGVRRAPDATRFAQLRQAADDRAAGGEAQRRTVTLRGPGVPLTLAGRDKGRLLG